MSDVSPTDIRLQVSSWQSKLIELNKRNPLYCLPANNRGVLPLAGVSPDELYKHLLSQRRHWLYSARDKSLIDVPEASTRRVPHHTELSLDDYKKLNGLRVKAASTLREQGINILYIVFGLLEWTDPLKRDVIVSPLVLVPVGIERLPGGEMLRLSRIDEDLELNPTLVYRLGQTDVNLTLPELPDEDDFVPSQYMAAVRAKLANLSNVTVHDTATVGRFSFLKMAMYRDLERQMERACSNPFIEALAGNTLALRRLPAVEVPLVTQLDRVTLGEVGNSVLDADPSQQRAILAARAGQSFVLQGPPGTGKTQTIANIIAECMATNKRVLFVSQKMAALDAVFKRLRDKRLHGLCLEAHSHKADKKAFVEQLRVAYEAQRREIVPPTVNPSVLDNLKRRLYEVPKELHLVREPLGISIFEAIGIIAAATTIPDLTFTFANPHEVDSAQVRDLEELAGRLAGHHNLFAEAWTHPWRDIIADTFTLDLQSRVRTTFGDVTTRLVQCRDLAAHTAARCGTAAPETVAAVADLVVLAELLGKSPHPPASWLVDPDLDELRSNAASCRLQYSSYKETKAHLLATWSDALFGLPHGELWQRLTTRHETALAPLLGETWQEVCANNYDALAPALQDTITTARQVVTTSASLAVRCGLQPGQTFNACKYLLRISEVVSSDVKPLPGWFVAGKRVELSRATDEAANRVGRYNQDRASLAAVYTDEVSRLDIPGLNQRFATEYASILRFCKPSYYRDVRDIKLSLQPGATLKNRTLLTDLRLARDVADGREWTGANDATWQEEFGRHYHGLDTDWHAIKGSLTKLGGLLELLPSGAAPPALIARMVASGPDIADIAELDRHLREQLARLQAAMERLGQIMRLAVLPFTELPFSQVPLSEFADWLAARQAEIDDFHTAFEVVHATQKRESPLTVATCLDALNQASVLLERERKITAESEAHRAKYVGFYAGLETNWDAVSEGLEWSHQVRGLFSGQVREDVVKVATTGSVPHLADVAASANPLHTRLHDLIAHIGLLSGFFPSHRLYCGEVPLAEATFDAIGTWLSERLTRLPELEQWIDFQNLNRECDRVGLLSFYETSVHRQPAAADILPAFRKRFFQLWYDTVCDGIPCLRQFRGDQHRGLVTQFRQADLHQIETAPERIRSIVQQRQQGPSVAVGQMGALKKLLKSKRLRSIRKLLADIPDVLFQYKPCLLMSPLSVSLFLEAEAFEFDVVIFDEASQIFIEDALCSILRAKQVIIAGDTEQLPPTAFFKNLSGTADDDDEDDEVDETGRYESVLQAAGFLSSNEADDASLPAAERSSARFAEHELTWHYRSRHDSLIAFSKTHFYERITAFPAPTAQSAVSLIHLANGQYLPGTGKRHNPVEARDIVDRVISHRRTYPDLSVGIITFNQPQRTLIEDLIEARQRKETDLVQLLSEEGSEGFFVKNIENVQGDERDVIFLSVGFGRTPDGKLSMDFGPINRDGGERRLNVAITRARHKMIVVSSILGSDIDLSRTDKRGPKLLKGYLDYAHSGGLTIQGTDYPQSAFEAAVEAALQVEGFQTKRNIGKFGYVMSIGIVHPKRPDEFILGIECDNAMYRNAATVRARDRLYGDVLQSLGWNLHRVWSCDWLRNPAVELSKIKEAVESALHPPAPARQTVLPIFADEETEDAQTGVLDAPLSGSKPVPVTAAVPETLEVTNLIQGTTYYKPTRLSVTWGKDLFYDERRSAQEQRCGLLLRIVECDGPMPIEMAIQRTAEAAGINRVGPRVREILEDCIEQLVEADKLANRVDFLYLRGASAVPARVARNGSPSRPIEHIAIEEIGEVIVALLKVSYGMRQDELILATAKLFGYRATSVNIRDRISEAISTLELDNRIHVLGGQIKALEQ